MFAQAGYNALQRIKDMQELGRTYFLSGIRKRRKQQPDFPELRLLLGLFETYGAIAAPKSSVANPVLKS